MLNIILPLKKIQLRIVAINLELLPVQILKIKLMAT